MCEICKKPRSLAQKRARERILRRECLRAFSTLQKFKKFLERKQFEGKIQYLSFISEHLSSINPLNLVSYEPDWGDYSSFRRFFAKFQVNYLLEISNPLKEENIFKTFRNPKFIWIPEKFYFLDANNSKDYYWLLNKAGILYVPARFSEELKKLLRKKGKEVFCDF